MDPVRVLVTMPEAAPLTAQAIAAAGTVSGALAPHLAGLPQSLVLDAGYAPVPIRRGTAQLVVHRLSAAVGADPLAPPGYVVRATVDRADLPAATAVRDPVGRSRVFSDPGIGLMPVCPGDKPVGTVADLRRLLGIERIAALGMDGAGVAVAVVDNGIALDFLAAHGLHPALDATASWTPSADVAPGKAKPDHGSMCAFAVLQSAPRATLLDYPVLRSTRQGDSPFDGYLSDAIAAYGELLKVMSRSAAERGFQSLVVSNSWGVFSPSWDFPKGMAGRYIDNAAHPFHRAVQDLQAAGADILFAAGNCGADCPDAACEYPAGEPTITGANAYAEVVTVAAVDVTHAIAGYSSRGPGAIAPQKPDLAAYSHFLGSEVFGPGTADSGTSAACPVAAGIVAALRSKLPFREGVAATSPAAVKQRLMADAQQVAGEPAHSLATGAGILDTAGFDRLAATT